MDCFYNPEFFDKYKRATEIVTDVADRWTSEDVSKYAILGINKPIINGGGSEVFDVFLKQLKPKFD